MTKKKMVLKIDIEDWNEEYQEVEHQIQNQDDLVTLAKSGIGPMELARNTIVSRELGLAEDDIIPDNKSSLNIGGAHAISQIFARKFKEMQTGEGKTIRVRELVGQTEDDDKPEIVDSDSDVGCQRAIKYLQSAAIGHIKSRLNIVAVNKGKDAVIEQGDLLIAAIKGIVDSIVDKFE
jgi:hypothetical protein